MMEFLSFLSSGALFGLVAGISPGPLLALVISETLIGSRSDGIKVAVAPAVTDLPILAGSLVILTTLSRFDLVFGLLSFAGAAYLCYLGYESIRLKRVELDFEGRRSHALRKGITTNLLSPHPYLFWITTGSPLVIKAYKLHWTFALLFIVTFFVFLIGTKITVAVVVGKTKAFLNTSVYRAIIRILGVALLVFALRLIYGGLQFLGVIG